MNKNINQVDNIPENQRSWVWTIVEKRIDHPELVYVSYYMGAELYEQLEPAQISNMKDYYDTNEPAEFDYDLDTEMMQKYITVRGKEMPVQDAIMEFLDKSSIIRDKQAKQVVKKFSKAASRRGNISNFRNKVSYKTLGIKRSEWEKMTQDEKDKVKLDYLNRISEKYQKISEK